MTSLAFRRLPPSKRCSCLQEEHLIMLYIYILLTYFSSSGEDVVEYISVFADLGLLTTTFTCYISNALFRMH